MTSYDDEKALTHELAELFERICDLTELAQFSETEALPVNEVVLRLRAHSKNSEADELTELHARVDELRKEHRPKH